VVTKPARTPSLRWSGLVSREVDQIVGVKLPSATARKYGGLACTSGMSLLNGPRNGCTRSRHLPTLGDSRGQSMWIVRTDETIDPNVFPSALVQFLSQGEMIWHQSPIVRRRHLGYPTRGDPITTALTRRRERRRYMRSVSMFPYRSPMGARRSGGTTRCRIALRIVIENDPTDDGQGCSNPRITRI
jgi:hypothetical protein